MKLDYKKPAHQPRKGSGILDIQKQPALAPLALTPKLHESRGSLQNAEININTASTQDRHILSPIKREKKQNSETAARDRKMASKATEKQYREQQEQTE